MPKGDRDTLKADPEDGTTPIANLLMEALAIAKLSGKEKGIILYLWRRTYGWNEDGKRLKEKTISLSEFGKVCNSDAATVSKLLSGLVKRNILKREFAGPGKGYTYSMNTRVGEWNKGCINHQLLKDLSIQGLVKNTIQGLVKNTTPLATNLASLKKYKEIIKKSSGLDKETTHLEELNQVNQLSEEMAEIVCLYEAEIDKITFVVTEELKEALKEYSAEQIKEAIKEAVRQNKRKWSYVQGILRKRKEQPGTVRKEDPDKYIKGEYGHMVRR